MNLTSDQIVALAPDDASVKAGRGLINPSKWTALGKSADALWGECQGSGSKPYRVSVDLSGPAFKCSCPSRKFPCKHGLGLMLIAAEKPAAIQEAAPPPWVSDWLVSRREKAERKPPAPAEKQAAPADPEAAARRAAKRLGRMKEGGAELDRWLRDQARAGLSGYPHHPASYFTGVAARMVDAQAPGLANEITRLESLIHSGEGWPERVLAQLGRMHLITEGLRRFESLPGPLQDELRASLGWHLEKEEVLAGGERVTDEWCVAGQRFVERDKLWERRTWLLGSSTQRGALLLDFAHGNRSFPVTLSMGTSFHAALAYYPSAFPLRALLVDQPNDFKTLEKAFPAHPDFAPALAMYAEAVALNPWVQSAPFAVDQVIPLPGDGAWVLQDAPGAELPLKIPELEAWELLSVSGGDPVRVFGEWNGNELRVLSLWAGKFHGFDSNSAGGGFAPAPPGSSFRPSRPKKLSHWTDMTSAALIGIGRGQAAFDLPGRFAELLQVPEPESRLLRAAAVLRVAEKAGRLASVASLATPSAAPPEELMAASDPVLVSLLARIIAEGRPVLVSEACQRLALKSHCLPARLLPRALEFGRRTVSVRDSLRRALGKRGGWLAQQNPDWKFALFAGRETADRQIWDEGDANQRASFLAELRRDEPGAARELLEQSFAQETARDRALLLPSLSENLCPGDEPFLAATLASDRSKEVRQVAAGLLSRLPNSEFAKRIIARLELCIRDERKRPALAFEPPVAFAADWKNDGLEEKPPAALKAGERAWWLFQLAAYAPLSWWENRFQLPPKDILELISKSEWKEALLGGFRSAMANQPGHPGWALALLEQGGLPDREAVLLAGTLPPSDADSALRHILRKTDDSMLAAELIETADFPWSGELWSLAKQKLSRWLAQEDWRFRNALTLLACRIPASSLREEVSFPDSSIFSDAIADFSRIHEQRKQLHQLL